MLYARRTSERKVRERAVALQVAEKRERAVEHADLRIAGDRDHLLARDLSGLDQVPFVAHRREARYQRKVLDDSRVSGADHDSAGAGQRRGHRDRVAAQAAQAQHQLGLSRVDAGAVDRAYHLRERRAVLG
jgi:hypothetical protein